MGKSQHDSDLGQLERKRELETDKVHSGHIELSACFPLELDIECGLSVKVA